MSVNGDGPVRILAISGSLRAGSSNTSILRSVVRMAPENVEIKIYEGLAEIPPFSPESDGLHSPQPVQYLRQLVKEADGVIICTPEYAFGVPGVLKNALDWTVSTGEFNEKPVSSISASPLYSGGDKALASLLLTLSALGTVEASTLSIPSINKKMNEKKEVSDTETSELLKSLLNRLLKTIKERKEVF
jgi:chromate reductase, NAD(P)H dehydrogenase (quinone)